MPCGPSPHCRNLWGTLRLQVAALLLHTAWRKGIRQIWCQLPFSVGRSLCVVLLFSQELWDFLGPPEIPAHHPAMAPVALAERVSLVPFASNFRRQIQLLSKGFGGLCKQFCFNIQLLFLGRKNQLQGTTCFTLCAPRVLADWRRKSPRCDGSCGGVHLSSRLSSSSFLLFPCSSFLLDCGAAPSPTASVSPHHLPFQGHRGPRPTPAGTPDGGLRSAWDPAWVNNVFSTPLPAAGSSLHVKCGLNFSPLSKMLFLPNAHKHFLTTRSVF